MRPGEKDRPDRRGSTGAVMSMTDPRPVVHRGGEDQRLLLQSIIETR